jgi:hypothetical protein
MASVDISGTGGAGAFVSGAYLNAFSNVSQTLVGLPLTPNQVSFGTTVFASGINISGGGLTDIVFNNAGIYNVQFSIQVTNNSNNEHEFYLWASKNSVFEPDTLSIVTIPRDRGGVSGHYISAWNFFFQVNAGDNVGLWWTANNANISIQKIVSPGGGIPSAPSVILTVSQV